MTVVHEGQEAKIRMRGVTKIFGPNSARALSMLESGAGKMEIQAETGCVVGLSDISLDVKAGQIFVVMGLSGSGKSTLIRHVNRLIEPTAGEIVIDGREVRHMNDEELRSFRRHNVAM